MLDMLRSVLAYGFDLGVLVFFHELGHYLAARSQGVVVEVFSVGFGPALVGWTAKSGTRWQLSAFPLGGYVKMQGWGALDDGGPKVPGSFSATSLGSKALIVAAGPAANLLLAFVLLMGLFLTVGQIQAQPVVSKVLPGTAAAAAGLQPGDRIVSLDGSKITYFEDMQDIIGPHPDVTMPITYLRAGVLHSENITLGETQDSGQTIGRLGVEGDEVTNQHFGPVGAVIAAGRETWTRITLTVNGLYDLVVHHQGLQNLGGPLRIAQISGQVAAMGLPSLIDLIALLSINLGLINLVPIPILDGGHLLFYAGEFIYGKPIPRRAQDIGLRMGLALIFSLYIFTTFNDLSHFGAVRWVARLFG